MLILKQSSRHMAIQFEIINKKYLHQERLGYKISTTQVYIAIELCALNVLAQIKNKIGFDKINTY